MDLFGKPAVLRLAPFLLLSCGIIVNHKNTDQIPKNLPDPKNVTQYFANKSYLVLNPSNMLCVLTSSEGKCGYWTGPRKSRRGEYEKGEGKCSFLSNQEETKIEVKCEKSDKSACFGPDVVFAKLKLSTTLSSANTQVSPDPNEWEIQDSEDSDFSIRLTESCDVYAPEEYLVKKAPINSKDFVVEKPSVSNPNTGGSASTKVVSNSPSEMPAVPPSSPTVTSSVSTPPVLPPITSVTPNVAATPATPPTPKK
jgi:uncharacterized low-complexity protein